MGPSSVINSCGWLAGNVLITGSIQLARPATPDEPRPTRELAVVSRIEQVSHLSVPEKPPTYPGGDPRTLQLPPEHPCEQVVATHPGLYSAKANRK